MNILVTGGKGFIGAHLLPALLDSGHNIRATTRKPVPGDTRVDWVACDLMDPACDLERLTAGIDTVVHLAALAHMPDASVTEQDYRDLNVLATENLLEACASQAVKRFVYLSSIKVLGDHSETVLTEQSPEQPDDAYGRSKLGAEQRVRTTCMASGIDFVILRPPLVYGPGVKANFLKLVSIIDKHLPMPLASVHNRRSLIYVRNLCDIITRCIEYEGKLNEAFLVSDCAVSTPDLIREIAAQMHTRASLFPFPLSLLRGLARIAGKTPVYERLAGSLQLDHSRFANRFQWSPAFSFSEGIRETVHRYRASCH